MGLFALQLEMTITLGNVLQAGATIIAILAAFFRLRERLVTIEIKLEPLWKEFERRRSAR